MGALVHVGEIHEPEDKLGVADLMMEGLRTGGSKSRSGDEIDRELEMAAVDLSAKAEREHSFFKVRCLSKEIDLSLDIFFDLLQAPAFEPAKIGVAKSRLTDQIRRRNENPMSTAYREYHQRLHGPKSVWARLSKEETVRSIGREEVQKFYEETVAPNRIWLAVSGDISFDELVKKIEKRIAGWPAQDANLPKPEPVKKEWRPSVNLISLPVNQSAIVMGHFGEKRFNPDKYAVLAANQLLGGSTFGSRLGDRIRTELGLAYSVYSDFGFSTDYGSFQMAVGTKAVSTAQVIGEARKILSALVEGDDITEAELENAKKVILNRLIFAYEDPFEIVSQRVQFDYFGYPPDYLALYQREIKKVTLDQVRDVLKRYYFPDRLIVMIVGDPSQMGDLSVLGEIEKLPLDND